MKEDDNTLNQYELVLASTEYIRQNPDAALTKKLTACVHQSDLMKLFKEEYINRVAVPPTSL